MISEVKRLVVVDLDGCLCTINTFRYWVIFSYLYLFLTLHWLDFFKFSVVIFRRLLGRVDRVTMKYEILVLTERLAPFFIKIFCRFLVNFFNGSLVSRLKEYDDSVEIVLSTAAPSCYVKYLVKNVSVSKFFATQSVFGDSWIENIGQVKLEAIRKYYGSAVMIDTVFTDHYDDLPLLKHARHKVLVRPDDGTLSRLRNVVKFDILPR